MNTHADTMPKFVFGDYFKGKPEVSGIAPGRIEVIGNHTDYNGGLVLGAAINRYTRVDVSRRADDWLYLHSEQEPAGAQIDHHAIQKQADEQSWANYILGTIAELNEAGYPLESGLNIAVSSTIPTGAGLSSSASLEVATLEALAELHKWNISNEEKVDITQRAENEFVGLPCGMLDQGTIVHATKNKLVRIDCHRKRFTTVELPVALDFWVFDTKVKHKLLDSLYTQRARECAYVYQQLKEVEPSMECLAQADPQLLIDHQEQLSAEHCARAMHVMEENERVTSVQNSLACSDITEVGRLLTASHHSSRRLFQNSCPELDYLVDRLTLISGVFGARLTGGGFGGSVLAITDSTFGYNRSYEKLATRFTKHFGHRPDVWHFKLADGAHAYWHETVGKP